MLTRTLRSVWGATLLVALLPVAASAGIIQEWKVADGGNGHFYELVLPSNAASSLTWLQARDAAAGEALLGSQGHLLTVGSAAENEFVRQQFSTYLFDDSSAQTGRTYAWIGLFAPTVTSPFEWVTGETVGYTNWAPSEPNFFGHPFWQYGHYWTRNFGAGPTWTWNNEKNDGHNPPFNTYGYIVEYDGPFVAQPVPEPSSTVSFIVGVLGLMGYRYWGIRACGG